MATKKISTELQPLDKFLDTSGDAGGADQVLVSTSTGINWVDGSGSSIIGGPYVTTNTAQTITGGKTFSDSILIDYTGSDASGRDAGLKIMNDASDWGIYIRKDSAANYGLRIDSGGTNALGIYSLVGAASPIFNVTGAGNTTIGGTIISSKSTTTGYINEHINPSANSNAYTSMKWKNDDTDFGEIWRNSSTRTGTGQGPLSFNMYNTADINLWSGASHTLKLTGDNAIFDGSVTTAGNILTLARAGIGTTSPQSFARVDVRSFTSAGSVGIASYGYNGVGGRGLHGQGYATDNTVAGTSTGVYGVANGTRTIAGSINIGGYFTASGSVNNYALLTGSGNVGINNSTPTFGLDVVGTARVTGDTQFVTQSTADDSTKVATTAFVKNILAEQPSGLTFLGDWNAATNSPTLVSGGGELASGSSTSLATDKLIDSAATFSSDGITANTDRIRLVQANGNIEFVVITAVDSDTQLTLASNAVTATGETYIVEASPFLSPEGGYYIVTTTGDEDLNGITDWTAGDWVLIATNNEFQKIDNTSILTGQGAEDKVAKWATSSGDPSVTLASSSITDTGSAVTIENPTTVTGNTTVTGRLFANAPTNSTHILTNASNNSTVLQLQATGDSTVLNLQTDHIYPNSGSLHLGNSTGDIYLKPSSSSGVGINTTSPRGKLQINGDGNSWDAGPSVRLWDTTNSKGWLVGNINNYTAGDFYIRTFASVNTDPTSTSQEFTIKHATGNVGIGTASPQTNLHIFNSAVGGNYYGQLVVETSGEAAIQLKGTTWSSIYFSDAAAPYQSGVVFNHSTNILELRGAGNTDDLAITEAGDIGIGTDAPGHKLDVNGITRADKFISSNASTNDTFVIASENQNEKVWTLSPSFTYSGAGVYYFNLAFGSAGPFSFDIDMMTGRNGFYRNFGRIKDSSYMYWETDGDFHHHAQGPLDVISDYPTGELSLDAVPSVYLSATKDATSYNGSSPWSYYIKRYAIRITGTGTGSDGYFKIILKTNNFNGTDIRFLNKQ